MVLWFNKHERYIRKKKTKNVKLLNNELGEATVVYGDEVKR